MKTQTNIEDIIVQEKEKRYEKGELAYGFVIRFSDEYMDLLIDCLKKEHVFDVPERANELTYMGVKIKRDSRLKSYKI